MTILSQTLTISPDIISELMAICYDADRNMDDPEFFKKYQISGFYYSMGKNFALRDVFNRLGLTDLYRSYERSRDAEN